MRSAPASPASVAHVIGRSAPPLVVRFGAFGDVVLLTPLLELLHRRYGQPCRVLGSGAWLAPLLAGNPDVEEVLTLRSRRRPYWLDRAQRHLVRTLRAHPPGAVYICDDYALDKVRWLLDRAGIPPERCIYANPGCMLQPEEHWVDRWLRFGTMTPPAFVSV
ncbi:MAG TPA: hypothetical protein VFH52_10620 [Rhodanobacteraceae bacterium]|nr:hypothetical protein [Rhodanobacteraceae bacterium]